MESRRLFKGISLLFVGSLLCISNVFAEDDSAPTEEKAKKVVQSDAKLGRAYFEGSKGFTNGGPACITCHNVKNDKLIPGGLLAKDLTDVYERLGEGITGWLGAPPFPAMVSSYQNHALTENERSNLTAFFKHANEVKDSQKENSGQSLLIMGGLGGLAVILILIAITWSNRKKHMVKKRHFRPSE